MLSVSAGHSAGYLTNSVGAGMEGYYTGSVGAGEPPGRWSGKGAERLGLSGEVDADIMHAIYNRFADPRDPRFADPESRDQAARLGKPPKQFRTPEQVVADRAAEYERVHSVAPTPEQVQSWRVQAEADAPKAVMFLDATFSPPKSVTVAHAAFSRAAHEANSAGRIEEAAAWRAKVEAIDTGVAQANAAMLEYLSQYGGYTRVGRHTGKGGSGRWLDAHDLVVASFYQHTSRDHDPQLHVHNAILNRVECPDGQWRAVDGRAVHTAIQGGGAVASSVLQAELTERLGVSWVMREDGNDFEIAGIDQDVMDLFSSRTKTLTRRADKLISDAETRLGRPLNSLERYRLSKRASLSTRQAKTHDGETEAERLSRWDAELQSEVVGGLLRTARQINAPTAPKVEEWSAKAVISQALEAVHGDDDEPGRSVWSRSDLTRRIHLALRPSLGLTGPERVELLERLTDQGLECAVLVSGREIGDVPWPDRLANGMSAAAAPYARRYATPGHLAAELALLDAAGVRQRACVARDQAEAWLDTSAPHLSPAQRAAVSGLASSDAAFAVLVGPAGTGKSYTAGALAGAWSSLAGGRVIGLATAETAAQVLMDDGLPDSANIAAFLTAQRRLADERPLPGDERWRIGPRDILAVDEASMLDTDRLTELRNAAEAAGARMVLMGDSRQLGAVGAGGMMRTAIEHGAETYTLSEVRRFTADWERAASLKLRDGDPAAIQAYDRHGRLRDAGRVDEAIAAVARAAAADRLAGREVVVTCGTNDHAAAVSAAIRRHLVDAKRVEEGGVLLGRDRSTAGVGDLVRARRIDRPMGLINQESYAVQAVRDDGGLDVVSARTGELLVMPASYVAADVSLGYASTAHSAQGLTVDAGHLLLTPEVDRAGAYVGLSRGRQMNTAWAVTVDSAADPDDPPATARGLLTRLLDDEQATSRADLSAVDTEAADEEHRFSAETLLARIEDQTRIACRERLDADLDELVARGVLSEQDRARFGAEQGTEHLSRQLRVLETAGHDPLQVLQDAVLVRDYAGAVTVSAATATRIEKAHGLPTPRSDAAPPARIDNARAEYLGALRDVLAYREKALGDQVAVEAPEWALTSLGPVPNGAEELSAWQERAGKIAAAREATGWDDPAIALGRSPGVSSSEKRLAWSQAWDAAGMPAEKRPAADLSDGRLWARVAAGERVMAHAPAAVYEQQRSREQEAADAAREADLARGKGRTTDAALHDEEAAAAAEIAGRLNQANTTRAHWLVGHAETLRVADEAHEETQRRGLPLGHEPDRDTAQNWLAQQRQAERVDEAHRVITEADVDERPRDLHAVWSPPAAPVAAHVQLDLGTDQSPPKVSASASAVEAVAVATHAAHQAERLADQASQDAAGPTATDDAEWHRHRTMQAAAADTGTAAGDGA